MNDLLLLVHRIPFPPNKGDKVRSFHLLKYLAKHYRVHLATFIDAEEDWQYVDKVRALCHDCFFAKLDPKSARLRSLRGLANGSALSLPYYSDVAMHTWVSNKLATNDFARAVVYSSPMAQYLPHKDAGMIRVADLVDVDSDKWAQYARTKPWPLSWIYRREARRLLGYEREIAREFDAVLFVNEREAALFRTLAPESSARVGHANNGVDTEYFSPTIKFDNPYLLDERVLVFTGAMDYWPNIDAVEWFAESIFPAIRNRIGNVKFYIVGARPSARVQELAELPGIFVTGSVADIRPYLAHADLAVAPLRIARGTQNKVLEAMAMGKLVIATREAAQGVDAIYGEELIVASDAAEFIQCISARLLEQTGDEIGVRARQCVVRKYGWDVNLSRIGNLLETHSKLARSANAETGSIESNVLSISTRESV